MCCSGRRDFLSEASFALVSVLYTIWSTSGWAARKCKKLKKILAIRGFIVYTMHCCDIDSVEAWGCCRALQVFRGANVKLGNWRQVTVSRIEFVRRTEGWRVGSAGFFVGVSPWYTRVCVQSPLVVQKAITSLVKVRKGGDFFYGKSSNENHTQGLWPSACWCVCQKNHRNLP